MSLSRIMSLAFVFSGVALAQSTSGSNGIFFNTLPGQGCPVEIRANLNIRASFVPIDKGHNGVGPQSLHLGIRNPKPQLVTEETIAVYGYPRGLRALLAVLLMPDPREIKKTFALSHSVSPGEITVMDLSLADDLSTVTHIEIESLTYADGSKWQPHEQQSCLARARTEIDTGATVAPR